MHVTYKTKQKKAILITKARPWRNGGRAWKAREEEGEMEKCVCMLVCMCPCEAKREK